MVTLLSESRKPDLANKYKRSPYEHGRSRSDLHKWERWQASHQSHPRLWTSLIVFQDKWQECKELRQESWPEVNSPTAAYNAKFDPLTLIFPSISLQKKTNKSACCPITAWLWLSYSCSHKKLLSSFFFSFSSMFKQLEQQCAKS